jgi:PIN domain nuclease of toxin-antitoxin system
MQSYLIDTQIFIWSLINPQLLSPTVRTILSENTIKVSQVSLLEIAIKQKLGKLPDMMISVEELEFNLLNDGFQMIALQTNHISGYQRIPLFQEHRDPFDRLLLATAYTEQIPVITSDGNFNLYADIVQVITA